MSHFLLAKFTVPREGCNEWEYYEREYGLREYGRAGLPAAGPGGLLHWLDSKVVASALLVLWLLT